MKYGIYANIFADIFFQQNTCEFSIIHTWTVNILTTNELVKLTILWTTGPRLLEVKTTKKKKKKKKKEHAHAHTSRRF